MTTLFLLLSLAIAWSAYNLFKPVIDRGGWSVLSWLAGWLVGELAIHHILWQVGLVALFVLFGVVDGLIGAIGFVLCVGSWIAMAYYYLRSDRAYEEINEALDQGLGAEYRQDIRPEFALQFPAGPDYEKIKRPFTLIDRSKVEVLKDISFGDHGQKLDIYRPRQSLQNAPVLFQIHGGAWTENYGSKNEQAIPLMTHMAERGWIAVATDYRLSPRATFPEHIIDCKQALVWVKEHIDEIGRAHV